MLRHLLLLVLFGLMPAPAHAAWHRVVSDHFIVYGDTGPEDLEKLVERVEKFDYTLRKITDAKADAAAAKLLIFVVRDLPTLQRMRGKGSKYVFGYYHPAITGSFVVVPARAGSGTYDLDAETVLFHEYAHHFMLQHFPAGYPAWYVEGFAEYYSTTEFRKDGTIGVGLPAKHRFASLIRDQPFPMARMFADDMGRLTEVDRSSFYSYAWLLTHYLSFDAARKGHLTAYLTNFSQGMAPIEAATKAFGDLRLLDRDLQRYLKARNLSYATWRDVVFPSTKIVVERLAPSENALMPLYIRFLEPHLSSEVAPFAADARIMAAKYPQEPRALEALAEGELDIGNLSAATVANDALLGLRPADVRAMLRRARIATAQMSKSKDFPGGWKEIRRLIVKANRAAPDDPYPLSEYFHSFRREGTAVPELAGKGLARALELAPQSTDLRFSLATYLLGKGDKVQARWVLEPLLNAPHNAFARTAARAMLDASRTAPALTASPEAKTK